MPTYKDKERGTWYASFYYTDWQGRRRLKKKRGFLRQKDAKAFEEEFLRTKARSCDMAFGSMVEIYFDDMKGRLKANTLKNKRYLVDAKILPFFRELPLNEITPAHVRKWQSDLLAEGLAPTYIKTINNQISAIFNYAVRYYGLQVNPARLAGGVGKKNADEMNFWTIEQFTAVHEKVRKLPARTGLSVLFWTGLRIRELAAELREYMAALYDVGQDDRLFPFTKHYFRREMLKASEAAGVERIRLHDLRHSHASLLIHLGCPVLLVSERLGHEDVQTTLRTYGHLYPSTVPEAVKKLDDLMP